MAEKVVIGNAELWHGDALEMLPELQCDLLLTDPPFGVRIEGWDLMDARQLWRFTARWATSTSANRVAVFYPDEHASSFRSIFERLHSNVRTLIWDKPLGSQYAGAAEDGMWYANEQILYCNSGAGVGGALEVAAMIREARGKAGLSRGAVEKAILGRRTGLCYRWEEGSSVPSRDHATALAALLGLGETLEQAIELVSRGSGVAKYRDVFSHRTVTGGEHPCQKPLGLMCELIDALSASGEVVADPFAGSGTTGVAAVTHGRRFIGIEKDARHFETACRRIEQAQAQGQLLPPEEPRQPVQEGLL